MDSGNSGSMQSSSGGDDEYDSRTDSISVFLNNNNNHHHHVVGGPMSNPPPPPPHHQPPPPQQHQFNHHQSMFDPLSNYFDPLPSTSRSSPQHFTNSNSLLNLDLLNWSKNIRSDNSNPADLVAFIASSSQPTQQFFATTHPPPPQTRPSFQIPQGQQPSSASGSALNDHTNNNNTGGGGGNVVRNPKKRSRASRRAPTTVLTTDTTNFRAMVQEFTGIPAPPFTSSSPFPIRGRLDLFGNSSTFRSATATSTHFESPSPPPSYLLRPFAQKIQPPPPFLSSSSLSSTCTNTTTCSSSSSSSSMAADAIVSTTTTTSNVNSDLGLLNPLLNFHPLFHSSSSSSSPKFPFSNNMKAAQLEIPGSDHSHLKMGVFDDFGLGHAGPGQNNWGGGDHEGGDDHNHNHGLLRSINGNYTASSALDFHGDKGTDNVATARTEGMMESWISSSD